MTGTLMRGSSFPVPRLEPIVCCKGAGFSTFASPRWACACAYMHEHTHVHMHALRRHDGPAHVHMCMCMCAYVRAHVHVYVCARMWACMWACMHVHACACAAHLARGADDDRRRKDARVDALRARHDNLEVELAVEVGLSVGPCGAANDVLTYTTSQIHMVRYIYAVYTSQIHMEGGLWASGHAVRADGVLTDGPLVEEEGGPGALVAPLYL